MTSSSPSISEEGAAAPIKKSATASMEKILLAMLPRFFPHLLAELCKLSDECFDVVFGLFRDRQTKLMTRHDFAGRFVNRLCADLDRVCHLVHLPSVLV